jgi:hypothetical protein
MWRLQRAMKQGVRAAGISKPASYHTLRRLAIPMLMAVQEPNHYDGIRRGPDVNGPAVFAYVRAGRYDASSPALMGVSGIQ